MFRRVIENIACCKGGMCCRSPSAGHNEGLLEDLVSHVHGENGRTTANIKDHLVLKNVLVLHDSVHVRSCADLIFLQL